MTKKITMPLEEVEAKANVILNAAASQVFEEFKAAGVVASVEDVSVIVQADLELCGASSIKGNPAKLFLLQIRTMLSIIADSSSPFDSMDELLGVGHSKLSSADLASIVEFTAEMVRASKKAMLITEALGGMTENASGCTCPACTKAAQKAAQKESENETTH